TAVQRRRSYRGTDADPFLWRSPLSVRDCRTLCLPLAICRGGIDPNFKRYSNLHFLIAIQCPQHDHRRFHTMNHAHVYSAHPTRSQILLEQARCVLPGGVSGAIRSVEPELVFTRAQGAYLFDAEGKRYIDYLGGFGPVLLGHCHPEVNQRVMEVLSRIDLIGLGAHELEVQLAEKICQHVPSAEKVVFCNSGSEATYLALRLARA